MSAFITSTLDRSGARRHASRMVFEIAEIHVVAGQEAQFEAAVARAVPLFQRAQGCCGMELQRTVEAPTKYRLVVQWETLEDHTVHFRGSADFVEWRRLVGGHFASPPMVEHTARVVAGFSSDVT